MTDKPETIFKFNARWKEELVVSCFGDEFILEYTMGVSTIFLPTRAVWQQSAPDWAKNHYTELKTELESWCKKNQIPLRVEARAWVDFDK